MKAVVIKSTGNLYTILFDNQKLECKIQGKFRLKGKKTTNPIAVGDFIEFNRPENSEIGQITNIYPRKNYIIRKATNLARESHVLAANVDQALLLVTLTYPKTYTIFIDRFLASAEAYRIPVIIVFNKIDLYDANLIQELNYLTAIYEAIGYQCVEISAENRINTDLILNILKGKTSMISGNSGVGKSTLINAIDNQLHLKVGEVSVANEQGKHITTFAEMFPLSFGGYIIDTPGVRGFGVIDMERSEMYHFFPEIFRESKNCKYHNCLHENEPHCAVIKAIEEGRISKSRYISYLSVLNGEDEKKYRSDLYR